MYIAIMCIAIMYIAIMNSSLFLWRNRLDSPSPWNFVFSVPTFFPDFFFIWSCSFLRSIEGSPRKYSIPGAGTKQEERTRSRNEAVDGCKLTFARSAHDTHQDVFRALEKKRDWAKVNGSYCCTILLIVCCRALYDSPRCLTDTSQYCRVLVGKHRLPAEFSLFFF